MFARRDSVKGKGKSGALLDDQLGIRSTVNWKQQIFQDRKKLKLCEK